MAPIQGLDPSKYFIIVPNTFGNGLSSSPSNSPEPFDGPRFPNITVFDNVAAQHRLVTEHLGIERLRLVLGCYMGAGQTYQWGVSYPQMMDALLPFCGSPRTAPHNIVFHESVRAAITADSTWRQGWYADQPKTGLRAAARVYAGWGFSQAFYWHEKWRKLGFTSLEDFLVGFWENFFLDKGRQQPADHARDLAGRRRGQDTGFRRPHGGPRWPPSKPESFRCLPKWTSTSRLRTRSLHPITFRTAKCVSFRVSGGTSPATARTPVDTAFIDEAVTELLG